MLARLVRAPLSPHPRVRAFSAEPLHQLLCDRHTRASVAVKCQGHPDLTYGELEDKSLRLASALHSAGVREGDRVGVMLPKIPALHITAVALSRLGAVYLPLFTAFGADAAMARVKAAKAAAFVTTREHRAKFRVEADTPVFRAVRL